MRGENLSCVETNFGALLDEKATDALIAATLVVLIHERRNN